MTPQFLPLPGSPLTLVNLAAVQFVQFATEHDSAVIHLGANAVTVTGEANVNTLRASFGLSASEAEAAPPEAEPAKKKGK